MHNRLEYLDSARGIAALTVLLSHFIGAYHLPASLNFMDFSVFHVFWHGEGAVVFFFLLSGFVLSNPYFRNKNKINTLKYKAYVLARCFRIYPLFWAVLILSIICNYYIKRDVITDPQSSLWIHSIWKNSHDYLKQAVLLYTFNIPVDLRMIPQDWTLTIEILISSLIPFLVIICLRKPLWMLAFILLSVYMLKLEPYCMVFTLGILIAYYLDRVRDVWQKSAHVWRIGFTVLALIFYSTMFLSHSVPHIIGKILTIFGASFFLIILLCSKHLQNILQMKMLTWSGRISYGIYLCHMVILVGIIPWILLYLNHTLLIHNEYLTRGIMIFILVALTFLLSYILHVAIEKPFIKLGKTLITKFFIFH